MRLFITGTDTEVGKSVVTACVAQALQHRGGVRALKPLASGVEPGTAGEDATLLGQGGGHRPLVFQTWETPVSPHRAALIEGSSLDPAALLSWIADQTLPEPGHTLVEGVGGWQVPLCLSPRFDVPDLAKAVGHPVLVVAANRLGVLNHTVLTVNAVLAAGHQVVGVVLNAAGGPDDVSQQTNLQDLRGLLSVPVATVPHLDTADPGARQAAGEAVLDALGLAV